MTGTFYINGKDAYTEFGITLDTSSLSALMTPPPVKEFIENKSRLESGKRVVPFSPQVDERSITFTFNLSASSEEQFFERYDKFCEELKTGVLRLETKYQPGVVYKTIYQSCGQFTQFLRGIAKFSLKLVEPNPQDRAK